MKKAEPIGTLCFLDGTEVPVIGETGRYWLCEGRQFRKNNPAVKGFTPVSKKPKLSKPDPDILEEVKEDASR